MPKISVVLPVYNGARFLAAAINSVLAQTFDDWELLVVDDGSTDETPTILAGYQDARIRIYHQPNLGEAAARNTALNSATGAYVAFLDADDLYLPGAFAAMLAFLEQHPHIGVLFCDGYVIDTFDRHLMTLTQHRPAIYTGYVLDAIVLDAAVVTVPVCTMTRSQAIRQTNAKFDTTLTIGPDRDFWIQLARENQFGYLDQKTCAYRVHGENITVKVGWQKRRHDLIAGRLKVMAAPWFHELRLETRYQFFYHLVVHVMTGSFQEQRIVLTAEPAQALAGWMQASLWRQISMQALLGPANLSDTRFGLEMALRADPTSRKTRGLLWLTNFGVRPARLVYSVWHILHRLGRYARKPFNKRSRPMPHKVPSGNSRALKENR